jgi:chromosome partitioning protein
MKTLAVFQLKGGVGKSTTAINLAALAAAQGHRTLVWDLDPQGATTWVLGVDPEKKQEKVWSEGKPIGRYIYPTEYSKLDVLAADLSLRKFNESLDKSTARAQMAQALAQLAEDYRFVIIDCPPMMTPQIEGILQAVDKILVPIEPSLLSIRAYELTREQLDWVKRKQWMPFVTMMDRRKSAHIAWAKNNAGEIRELLPVFIGFSASAEKMLQQRAPVVECLPHVPMSRNYRALWSSIQERL